MTTWNTQLREAIQALDQSDKDLDLVGWPQQIVKGKERNCCRCCGFCPDALSQMLKECLMEWEGGNRPAHTAEIKRLKEDK